MAEKVFGFRMELHVPKGQEDVFYGLIRGAGVPKGSYVTVVPDVEPKNRNVPFLQQSLFKTLYDGEKFRLSSLSSTIAGFKIMLANKLKKIFKSNLRNHMGDKGPWRRISEPRIWRRQALQKFGVKFDLVGGITNPMSIYTRGVIRDIENLKVLHNVDDSKHVIKFAAQIRPRSKSPDFEQLHSGFSPTEAHVLQYGMVIHSKVLETRSGKRFVIPVGRKGSDAAYFHAYLTASSGTKRFRNKNKPVSSGVPVIFVNSGELRIDEHVIRARPFMHARNSISYLKGDISTAFAKSRGASPATSGLDAMLLNSGRARILR